MKGVVFIDLDKGTVKIVKNEEIKIRLTKEQKDLIKRVAKLEKKTMSEFILSHVEHIALSKESSINNRVAIESRIENLENEIENLKKNMESKKEKYNKKLFKLFK